MTTTDEKTTTQSATIERRGNLQKCPVCGMQVDPDAYLCPHCRNYYCFHCRTRLLVSDQQFQCVNRDCGYYGKLLCSLCDPLAEKDEPPAVYAEPEDGYWPAWLAVVLIAAAATWYFTSFLVATGTAIIAFILGGFLLHRAGMNIFGRDRKVEQQRKSTFHCCISCQQPAKEVAKRG